jgi:hypothetical protein
VRRHGIRVVAGAEPAGVRGNEQGQCASRTVGNGTMAGPWITGKSRQKDRQRHVRRASVGVDAPRAEILREEKKREKKKKKKNVEVLK